MLREGNQARPTVLDLRSSLEGVHGFESHPSHTVFKNTDYPAIFNNTR